MAVTILAAKGWVTRKVIADLQDEFREKCGAETTEVGCNALGGARVDPCIWDPPACTLNPAFEDDSSINTWLQWTMIALFGLAFGQVIRLASSHIFRKATKDQVRAAASPSTLLSILLLCLCGTLFRVKMVGFWMSGDVRATD